MTFTTRPEIVGRFGVAASTHWIASAVAMGILERGGNAFDAGVAAGFTLQIVEPHLNGPAGDVPIMLHHAASGKTVVICGQGPAPQGATIEHFEALNLDLIPGTGLLAPCIPGAFDAWMLLLRDYGTMPLRTVLEAAIGYAHAGIPVLERIHATIATVEQLFVEEWPSSAAVFLPGGKTPVIGSFLRNPVLAALYERIVVEAEAVSGREQQIERARKLWSEGFVAETVDRFCRGEPMMDVSGRRHRGVLTGEDMAGWSATLEDPIGYDYGEYRVLKPGVWTQGLAALQQFALLSGFELRGADVTGAEFIHLQVEAAKLAFADREKFYGDPRYADVPVEQLLSKAYNDERRKLIANESSNDLRPGDIEGFGGSIRQGNAQAATVGAGEPTTGRLGDVRGDTCHFDIIDRHGNMVCATPSGGWLQSSPAIPGLGFALGTRAQMFSLDRSHPNALVPGKRPRTTLTPTMALRGGLPYIAWGTPGGDQQDQWNVQFLLRHIHAGMNLQQAIDAPAWHSEHFPSSFWPRAGHPGRLVVESRLPASTVTELERRGHEVIVGGSWSEGRLSAATIRDGVLRAAANPRGMQGYALGR